MLVLHHKSTSMKTRKLSVAVWLGIVFASLLTPSCKKTTSKPAAGNNQVAALLVDKNWVITAASMGTAVDVNQDGVPDTDLYNAAIKGTCREDDYLRFLADGNMLEREGENVCSDEIRPTWHWALAGDGHQLVLTPSTGTPTICEILSISIEELRLRYIDTELFGQPVELTVTYKKNITL